MKLKWRKHYEGYEVVFSAGKKTKETVVNSGIFITRKYFDYDKGEPRMGRLWRVAVCATHFLQTKHLERCEKGFKTRREAKEFTVKAIKSTLRTLLKTLS